MIKSLLTTQQIVVENATMLGEMINSQIFPWCHVREGISVVTDSKMISLQVNLLVTGESTTDLHFSNRILEIIADSLLSIHFLAGFWHVEAHDEIKLRK